MPKAPERIIDEILVLDAQAGKTQAMEALISRRQTALPRCAYERILEHRPIERSVEHGVERLSFKG